MVHTAIQAVSVTATVVAAAVMFGLWPTLFVTGLLATLLSAGYEASTR